MLRKVMALPDLNVVMLHSSANAVCDVCGNQPADTEAKPLQDVNRLWVKCHSACLAMPNEVADNLRARTKYNFGRAMSG